MFAFLPSQFLDRLRRPHEPSKCFHTANRGGPKPLTSAPARAPRRPKRAPRRGPNGPDGPVDGVGTPNAARRDTRWPTRTLKTAPRDPPKKNKFEFTSSTAQEPKDDLTRSPSEPQEPLGEKDEERRGRILRDEGGGLGKKKEGFLWSGRIFPRKTCIYNYVALCKCSCAPVEMRRQPPNAHDGQRSSTGPTDIPQGPHDNPVDGRG